MAELARAGLVADLSTIVDVDALRSRAGDYLVRLGRVGTDGTWPAARGGLYGAAFAATAEGLVWYPKAAFDQAGYPIPRTLDDLEQLTMRMVADGRTPWCLGLEDGATPGASAAAFVEDLVLHMAGPDVYDAWAAGTFASKGEPVRAAYVELGGLLSGDGRVAGGMGSAELTPQRVAAWPMFVQPPGLLAPPRRRDRPARMARGRIHDARGVPVPRRDTGADGRGQGPGVHGRRLRATGPRCVGSSTRSSGIGPGTAEGASLAEAGIVPFGSASETGSADAPSSMDGDLLAGALRDGTFRVSASDLVPPRVAAALRAGTIPLSRRGIEDPEHGARRPRHELEGIGLGGIRARSTRARRMLDAR